MQMDDPVSTFDLRPSTFGGLISPELFGAILKLLTGSPSTIRLFGQATFAWAVNKNSASGSCTRLA